MPCTAYREYKPLTVGLPNHPTSSMVCCVAPWRLECENSKSYQRLSHCSLHAHSTASLGSLGARHDAIEVQPRNLPHGSFCRPMQAGLGGCKVLLRSSPTQAAMESQVSSTQPPACLMLSPQADAEKMLLWKFSKEPYPLLSTSKDSGIHAAVGCTSCEVPASAVSCRLT